MFTLPGTIKTRISTLTLMGNDILKIEIDADAIILIEDINELLEATYKIGQGKKFKKLITMGEYTLADLDAMKLSGSEDGCKYKIAEAYVIKGMAQHILVHFYMHVIKPLKPTQFFENEAEAESWLLSLN
jgi:hypothetical protein